MTTTPLDTSTPAGVAVRAVLDEHAAAHAARDVGRLLRLYDDDAVSYTLAPPLQQGPDSPYGTPDGIARWFGTFDGPVVIDYRDPVVAADGDVAFVHTLTLMTARAVGQPESFSLWYRSTFGLRRHTNGWRIVHRHESTPFHMDGSFRAAVELQP